MKKIQAEIWTEGDRQFMKDGYEVVELHEKVDSDAVYLDIELGYCKADGTLIQLEEAIQYEDEFIQAVREIGSPLSDKALAEWFDYMNLHLGENEDCPSYIFRADIPELLIIWSDLREIDTEDILGTFYPAMFDQLESRNRYDAFNEIVNILEESSMISAYDSIYLIRMSWVGVKV